MLLSLSIQNLVLIDQLHLTLEEGLTVLTGETGAGKSILLDALGLALGRRGDAALIRQGTEQAVVSAEFCIKNYPAIFRLLQEHGLAVLDDENAATLVFRRILSRKSASSDETTEGGAGSRSRAFINDQMVSIGLLRLLGDSLLEIHGQFDRLLEPTSYRLVLDEYAGNKDLCLAVAKECQAWQMANEKWEKAHASLNSLRQNEDFLKHKLAELKSLGPVAGEEESLLKEREDLAYAGKLSEAIQDVNNHLQAGSFEAPFYASLKSLQKVQGLGGGKIDAARQALERALTEIVEARAQVQDVWDLLANQPRRLQEIDERLYVLRAAARKYGVSGDALAALHDNLENQLDSLDQAADILCDFTKARESAWKIYSAAALQLHHSRQEAAKSLEIAVMAELPSLKLPYSRFSVHISGLPERQWGESGMDRIDFMVAMNRGQELCSLGKSASGGELARLMLALKVVLASRSSVPTVIFDEIDTGVGGAVAAAIGERLAAMAAHVQVLAITHSPQLAACARHHFLVYKQDHDSFTQTTARQLSCRERQDELARMLSGAEITVEAHAAAVRLLRQGASGE